jgi:hypothetical protein
MDPADRRARIRLPADEVVVTLRAGYRVGRVQARVLDFNRYGLSVRTDRPLPPDGTVDLSLALGAVHVSGVVAVIHNCRLLDDGCYRCGLQFRTDARAQFDRNQIRAALARLENALAELAAPTPDTAT